MKKFYPSFAAKLSRYLLAASVALYILAILNITIVAMNLVKKETISSASNTLSNTLTEVELMLSEVKVPVENMSWVVKKNLENPDYMYEVTSRLVSSNSLIIGSTVAFTEGYYPKKGKYFAPYSCLAPGSDQIMSFQMGGDDYDYFAMDWFTMPASKGEPCWSEPYFDTGGGDSMMSTFSLPIKDEDGKLVAVITSDISLADLTDRLSNMERPQGATTFLISDTGTFLSHPDSKKILNENIFDLDIGFGRENFVNIGHSMLSGESGSGELTIDGHRYFIVYGALRNGWSAAMICPYVKLFASIIKVEIISILLMVLGLLAFAYVGRRIISRLTQPLTQFSYAAQTLAKGNFNATIPEIGSTEEMLKLGQSFAYLQESIHTYINELKTTTVARERMQSELGIARNIQLAMVPKVFPKDERFDLKATMKAAKEVGGDLYDFIIEDGRLTFIVGDVSGKGVSAAMFMAIVKACFHHVAKRSKDAAEVVSTINNVVSEDNASSMFVTIFVGIIDLNTLEMNFCNGGHNPIVIVGPDGKASYLHAKPNLAAGFMVDFPYQNETVSLPRGSRLLVYTDGVTEAENRVKDQYGEDRLLDFCSNLPLVCDSSQLISSLFADVRGFADGNDQNDDITIMSIRV